MYNEPKGIPVPTACEPTEGRRPLIDGAELIHEKATKVLRTAESIYGTLYNPHMNGGESEDQNKPRLSLEETLGEIHFVILQLDEYLSETLKRLRG